MDLFDVNDEDSKQAFFDYADTHYVGFWILHVKGRLTGECFRVLNPRGRFVLEVGSCYGYFSSFCEYKELPTTTEKPTLTTSIPSNMSGKINLIS
jgi:hypothetical protein